MMLPPIIDMRLRPPVEAWTRGSVFRTAMHYPRHFFTFKGARSAWLESVDILFEEMDSAGIKYGVAMGRASSGAGNLGGVANKDIVDLLERYPNRFLDSWEWTSMPSPKALQRFENLRFRGA